MTTVVMQNDSTDRPKIFPKLSAAVMQNALGWPIWQKSLKILFVIETSGSIIPKIMAEHFIMESLLHIYYWLLCVMQSQLRAN